MVQKARPDPYLLLDDGIKGNFNQTCGIANSFPGAQVETFRVFLGGPSYRLPKRKGRYPVSSKVLALLCSLRLWKIAKKVLANMMTDAEKVCQKKFDLVISAGSVLAPVNLILSKETGAKSLHIMVPSFIPLRFFDYLVVPYHDHVRLKGKRHLKNLIVTLGAPNLLSDDFLKRERERLKNIINIPDSRETVGIIIGGDDQNYRIPVSIIKKLMKSLESMEGRYNFLLTTSRRTGAGVVSFLQQYIKNRKFFLYSEFPGHSEGSHYPGMLSLCDYILVTEDSVNMISESASTGKPVIIMGVEREKPGRLIFDLTIEKFIEKGYAEYLPAKGLDKLAEKLENVENTPFKKLNEAEECARKISKTLT